MIFTECKADTELVKVLTNLSKRQIVHAGNKPRVLKRMERLESRCIGLVDEDPLSEQPPEMEHYRIVEELRAEGLLIRRKSGKILVVVCPELEPWVIRASEEVRLDLSEHALPSSPSSLRRALKANPQKARALFEALLEKGSKRMHELRRILNCLISWSEKSKFLRNR